MNTSCVDPGQIATFLPRRSFRLLIVAILRGDHGHALVAGRGDHHHRLMRGGAQDAGGDAESGEIDRFRDHGVLALGRAFERDHLDFIAGGGEALVEIRRDRMDQLQRPHLDDHGFIGRSGADEGQGQAGGQHGTAFQSHGDSPDGCSLVEGSASDGSGGRLGYSAASPMPDASAARDPGPREPTVLGICRRIGHLPGFKAIAGRVYPFMPPNERAQTNGPNEWIDRAGPRAG